MYVVNMLITFLTQRVGDLVMCLNLEQMFGSSEYKPWIQCSCEFLSDNSMQVASLLSILRFYWFISSYLPFSFSTAARK